MAKQCGPYIITGTIDNVCFYEMNGKGYARISNPLSSKRVKTAPEFEGTRRHAALLQQASPLACTVYKTLPKEKRNATHRRRLTGTAIQMLKQGHAVAAIAAQLQADALIMLAELLINEAPQAIKVEKRSKVDEGNVSQTRASRSFRRVKKVAVPRIGLRGTALYTYYVASGVAAFRLPQYPELVFRKPQGERVYQGVSPERLCFTGLSLAAKQVQQTAPLAVRLRPRVVPIAVKPRPKATVTLSNPQLRAAFPVSKPRQQTTLAKTVLST
jgi:hypothetical protein